MSVQIGEGRHRLHFDPPWVALKWDDHPAFKAGIHLVAGVKAVDVAAYHPRQRLGVLLEIKDPAQALSAIPGEGEYVPTLADIIASKVVGTLAGLQWSRPAAVSEAEIEPVARIADGMRAAGLLVLVVLEVPRAQISTVPPAVQRRLRRALQWLPSAQVAVIGGEAAAWPLPDSTCELEAA